MDENKTDEAIALAYKLLKQSPDSPQLKNLLGRLYGEMKGDIEAAIPYLNKALELDPTFVSAYENLGIAYATKGNFPKALELLQKALELDPENTHVMNNIAMLYGNMGDTQKEQAFRQAHGL
jgi:Flp pilus assembly protein TadD